MIFFDLEFYVPPSDRNDPSKKGTLIFNPGKPTHKILGGHFILKNLESNTTRKENAIWEWNVGDERDVLERIYELFVKEWKHVKSTRNKVLGKRIRDIITTGVGISRIDLPALFIRCDFHKVKSKPRLFEVFLKTKCIELSNTASFLFPEEKTLYPKTANEITKILNPLAKRKKGGKSVWKYYDSQDYGKIQSRCEKEVKNMVSIYEKIKDKFKTRLR